MCDARDRKSTRATTVALVISFQLLGLLVTSCNFVPVMEDIQKLPSSIAPALPLVPPSAKPFVVIAATALSALASLALAIHKWKVNNLMRKGIDAHTSTIDAAKYSVDPEIAAAAKKTLDFTKTYATLHNPSLKKGVEIFDGYRKGYR